MNPIAPGRLVLALDTATDQATVSLLRVTPSEGVAVLASRSQPVKTSHARRLLFLMEDLLGEAAVAPVDLTSIVVGRGPGTFTGVRLGVAVARAAALSLDIPVSGVTTLSALAAEAIAGGAGDGLTLVVPVTDARRGEVFATVYAAEPRESGAAAGPWRRVTDIFSCAPDALDEAVRRRVPEALGAGPLLVAGPVAPGPAGIAMSPSASFLVAGQERLSEPGDAPEGDRLVPWLLGASDLKRAAWGSVPGGLGSPESVVPVYVRPPDADLHITKMRDPWAS